LTLKTITKIEAALNVNLITVATSIEDIKRESVIPFKSVAAFFCNDKACVALSPFNIRDQFGKDFIYKPKMASYCAKEGIIGNA